MIRIVLDGRIVLPRMTGAGRYVVEIGMRLPRLDPGIRFDLLLSTMLKGTDTAHSLEESGARVHYCAARVASLGQWLELPPVLRRIRPDLYHYPFVDLPYVGCPSVVTIYDLNPVLRHDYFTKQGPLRRLAARAVVRSTLRRCRLALAISDTVRREVEEHYPLARGKVRTTHLGVDPGFSSASNVAGPASEEPHDSDPQWDGRPYVLYVGVDRPHKNLIRLVRAFIRFHATRLWPTGGVPYLWLAGVGAGSHQLRFEVEVSSGAGGIRFTTAVSEARLRRLYQGARVVAYVSTSEGFGLPVLEAMAAGVPVVAANASSLPEVAGDAAVYVSPDDEADIARGLDEAWSNDELRHRLVARGRHRIRDFSWARTATDTMEAYIDAVRQGSRR